MAKARFVKDLAGWVGHAILYQLDPAMRDDEGLEHQFVVVSATIVSFTGAETYIFPSDEEGEVVNFSELPGSTRGTLSHRDALRNAGYEEERND